MKKLTPRKELPKNFTALTLRLSRRAKKRANLRSVVGIWVKRLVPAGAIMLAVVTSSAGVYAAANWFDGQVEVKNDPASGILSVNVQACQSQVPPGFESTAPKSNLEFKTMRADHIAADDLRQILLIGCEFSATVEMLQDAGFTHTAASEIVKIDGQNVTLAFNLGPTAFHKDVHIPAEVPVYILGDRGDFSHVKVGDYVVIAYNFMDAQPAREDQDQWLRPVQLLAIAKTSYDTRIAPQNSKAFYEENGIMPLSHYQSLQQ